MTKNKILKIFISFVTYVIVFILGIFVFDNCDDAKLDKFVYSLINPDKVTFVENVNPPIIEITKNDEKRELDETVLYPKLFKEFQWNNLINGFRQTINNEVAVNVGSNSYDLKLVTQSSFYVYEEIDTASNSYFMDYGHFNVYLPGNLVERHRGEPDGVFMFISDTLADKIVADLNITGETKVEKYTKLVTNESLSITTMDVDGAPKHVAINNVIYTGEGFDDANRVLDLYSDFALTWTDRIASSLNVSFEIDLKTSSYSNKKVLKTLINTEYTAENCSYSVKTADANGIYSASEKLSNDLSKLLTGKNNVASYLFIFDVLFLTFGLCIFVNFTYQKDEKTILFLLTCAFFITYGIVSIFIYIYPLWTIVPILALGTLFATGFKSYREEITNYFRKVKDKKHEN